MPTCAILKADIEEKLSEDLLDEDILSVFNECLTDLAEVARLITIKEATATEKSLPLPDDVFEVIALQSKNLQTSLNPLWMGNSDGQGYKKVANIIELQEMAIPDQLTIWYYRFPAILTSINDVPDIPKRFHNALKYYYIGKYQQNDEELELERDYMQSYYEMKSMLDRYSNKQKGFTAPRRVKVGAYR